MATSKLPCEYVLVPEPLLRFAADHHEVHCNLRPSQRIQPQTEEERRRWWIEANWDSFDIKPIAEFLKALPNGVRIAIHLQGYGTETGTAVAVLTQIFWNGEGYPRLDFVQPDGMAEVHGCPNFWGAFILAIAKVNPETPEGFWRDADAAKFLEIAREHAI